MRRHHARCLHHEGHVHRQSQCLAFWRSSHPKTRHLLAGVVAGIGGYGNCTGVPTVGGETNFDAGYNGNILVNAMCVGLAKEGQDFLFGRQGVGLPVVYVGSRPAATASTALPWPRPNSTTDRTRSVPPYRSAIRFTEKLLIEACLELMAQRCHRRHPGHGRRRPHLLDLGDGRQGRRWHRARSRSRCRSAKPA